MFFVQGVSALGSAANRNFISNAGFVITHDSVVVIDALGSRFRELRVKRDMACSVCAGRP